MPGLDAILAVTLAGFALSATPGPSMLYVLSRSVGQNQAAGLASAVGLCLGGIILAVATALGLAALFETYEWMVVVLRYVGSAYLIWLGVDMIRGAQAEANAALNVEDVERRSISAIIWQGIVVEVLNPKTVLFFALFLPPFIVASEGGGSDMGVTLQLLILGALVPLTAIPADILVSLMGSNLASVINDRRKVRVALAWICGVVLVGIAINLHFPIL